MRWSVVVLLSNAFQDVGLEELTRKASHYQSQLRTAEQEVDRIRTASKDALAVSSRT